jgi:Rrf2 family protein
MKFSAQEEYGLRCMVAMARHDPNKALAITDLARTEKLTPAYVGKLMRILRRGGLVESLHGPTGGYRLSRRPTETSVGEILSVLGGRLYEPGLCKKFPGDTPFCVHTTGCAIRSLWVGLDLIVGEVLSRTRLADLIRTEKTLSQWIRGQIPALVEAAARAAGGIPRLRMRT